MHARLIKVDAHNGIIRIRQFNDTTRDDTPSAISYLTHKTIIVLVTNYSREKSQLALRDTSSVNIQFAHVRTNNHIC